MVNAARKLNRVTQVGTQQRSMPMNNWASDLVKNGALGKILTVLAPNFVGPDKLGRLPRRSAAQGRKRQLVGHLDQSGRRPAVSRQHPARLGPLVGLRRRRALLRRDRLGHPLLRPDQPRPGHRRHRAGRSPARRAGQGRGDRQVRSRTRSTGLVGEEDTGTPYHSMAKLIGPRAKVTMKFANGTEAAAAPRRRPWPRPGRHFRRREGQDRDQPRQDRHQSEGASSNRRTIPATTSGPRRPITSRTGSSASRAANPATPTSRSASGRPRSATW